MESIWGASCVRASTAADAACPMLVMQLYDSPCPIRFCPSGDRGAIEGLFDELIPRSLSDEQARRTSFVATPSDCSSLH